jgi:hypothetical protein
MTTFPMAMRESSVPSTTRSSGPAVQTTLCLTIATVARDQFRRWRPGGTALEETSAAASPILQEYYRVGVGVTVTDAEMRSKAYQSGHPWSAVFVSYVMRTAGAGSAFAYSAAHQHYIRAARRNRLNRDTANPFWAFRASEIAPQVGDLVCASRSGSGATYDNIGDPARRATHCDIVVEVRPGRIQVIGGNVGQTVGEKPLRTLPDGRLILTGPQSAFFAIVRCGSRAGTGGAGPAPAPRPPRASSWDAPALRVMELLVRQYGFPVNGAAGIVGNLIGESGVIPSRIQGSDAATPLLAHGFDGRLHNFKPEQVRDRDESRRTGPRAEGIGLAQWTSSNRRRGLFLHRFRGRVLGPAILLDLEAQVDYLVTELRRDYRAVNATLMAPSVTIDQASDAVLLGFERPKRKGPQAIRKRRGYTADALRIYRAAHPNGR